MPAGATRFDHVLAPGRLGPLTLGNRIVMPAMDMNLCDDGAITDGEIAHYRTRAVGGTAMVITGSGAVAFPVGAASRRQPGLSDDRFVPGLRRLSDAGALFCVQLTHHGATARVDIAEGRPLFVPSVPRAKRDLSSLKANTPEDIQRLIASTGDQEPQIARGASACSPGLPVGRRRDELDDAPVLARRLGWAGWKVPVSGGSAGKGDERGDQGPDQASSLSR